MQAAFFCAGQREQLKKIDDPSEQQCGEHCADTDAVKRAVLEQAQSSTDGNHREVKPVLDGGKPQMKHPLHTPETRLQSNAQPGFRINCS